MGKFIDLTGKTFGRLTVLGRGKNTSHGNPRWDCACGCGGSTLVQGGDLRGGVTTSCGCYRREFRTTHGLTESKEYRAWCHIKGRCYNERDKKFYRYGGRGITVCARWQNSIENFFSDMGEAPTSKHSIDRENNNLNYSPGNCRWASYKQQANNTRRNVYLIYRGRSRTLSQWADEMGLAYSCLYYRISQGWEIEKALTTKSGG